MSGFADAIAAHVAASIKFKELGLNCKDADEAKDWTLASKNEAQAALALVQAKKTIDAGYASKR